VASDICYPPDADWTCAFSQEELDTMLADPATATVMERADALAWSTLSALTGYRLSLCPIELRPCLARCMQGTTWQTAPVESGGFSPFVSEGRWYNGCGCKSDCSCTSLCEVIMPGEVGSIESVWLDGVELEKSSFRVDNGNRLVRTDGGCWPACQDMTAPSEPQYEPVVINNPTNTITITREGQTVTLRVEPTDLVQGGGFAGVTPWVPAAGMQQPTYNASGGAMGTFVLSAGSPNLGGSTGPGFAPFTVVYGTSTAPAPADAMGSFIVSYHPGVAPNDLFRYAAGVLAVEFFRACSGKDCRLPSGVTNISRAGMTMEISPGTFPGGMTGIPEVDAVIRVYNPYALKSPARVLSPDRRFGRIPTWG
jgi:hypothetical protein